LDTAADEVASKLSSAHVYLRQPLSQPHGEWDKLPTALVNDAAQLVKVNSIEGEPVIRGCSRLVLSRRVSIPAHKTRTQGIRRTISLYAVRLLGFTGIDGIR